MNILGKALLGSLFAFSLVACSDNGGGNDQDTATDSSTDTAGDGYVPDPLGTPVSEDFGEENNYLGVSLFVDVTSGGQPAVYSVQNEVMSTVGLLLTRSGDGTWTEISAFSEGYAFALDAGDLPHVAFTLLNTDTMTRSFRFGRYESGDWAHIIVDTEAVISGGDVDMALGDDTRIHLAYHDVGIDPRAGVKYAVSQTTDFATEVVEMQEDGAFVGEDCQIALGGGDTVYVAYLAESTTGTRSIKLATKAGGTWSIEDLEITQCGMTGLDVFSDDAGEPQIVCGGSGTFWIHLVGGSWVEERISYGSMLAAGVDSRGMPHVIGSVYGTGLVYVRPSGSGWEENTMAPWAETPGWAAMALDSDDLPHVVFWYGNRLRYIHY